MAESVQLTVNWRRRRHAGNQAAAKPELLPAVVYGHKEATVPVAVSNDELHKAVRHGARVVDLKTGGKTEKALIRELQWDHLGQEILHVDFAPRLGRRADRTCTVPHRAARHRPGVDGGGGVLDQPLHTVAVECLAVSVPESIRVNIGELQIGRPSTCAT